MSENVLRDKMEQLIKVELRTLALHTRAKLDLTQTKMGDRYVMSFKIPVGSSWSCNNKIVVSVPHIYSPDSMFANESPDIT